ncbi:MAG: hypothetical protein WBY66_07070, partial [Candidatus Acidiferrales bacterium]
MKSTQKLAAIAVFVGLLSLEIAYPCRAQATPPQRNADVAETNDSSSIAAAANLASADQPTGSAVEPASASPTFAADSTASDSNWHFAVTPYLWFAGAHGNVGGPNGGEVGFSASPGDLLSHFRIGLMGVVEPRYKRIVMPLDIFWIRLGSDRALPNTPGQGVANLRATEFFLTQKVGYRVIDQEKIKIDALAGFRYWHFGQSVSFTTNTLNFSGSQNWVDPVVGGRITGILTPKFTVNIGGDVGGWGAASQIDYQI